MKSMGVLVISVLGAVDAAFGQDMQGLGSPVIKSLHENVLELQREFEQNEIRLGRLTTMQFRHALGLRIDAEQYFQLSETDRQASVEQLNAVLQNGEAEVARLSAIEQQQRREFEQKRAAALKLAAAPKDDTWPGIDSPTLPPGVRPPPARWAQDDGGTHRSRGTTIAPMQPAPSASVVPSGASPVLVKGSLDHSAVGRALFHAGRFEDAARELALVIKNEKDLKTAPLVDVFYLARCRERLADLGGAESLYLTIIARDEQDDGQRVVTGPWASSARAAMKIMRWMDDKGSWQPAIPIDSLRIRREPADPR